MYTDKNVPIDCGECEALCEGFDDILSHILEAHGQTYDQKSAVEFAEIWTETAHVRAGDVDQRLTEDYHGQVYRRRHRN